MKSNLNKMQLDEKMEYNDVINKNDEVVGKVLHSELYNKKLPHRIVHILLFDENQKIILQKRSKHKSFCPQHWSTSVGGHVMSGESYEDAAIREFKEELGANVPIKFLFKFRYDVSDNVGDDVSDNDSNNFFKMISIFKANFNGPFELNPEEVESISSFSLDDLSKMIMDGELFHPELKFLIENHINLIKN